VSNIPNIIGGLIALAAVNRLLDTKPTGVTPTTTPKPLIPKPMAPAPVVKPVVATRAEPITPFITVQQRAEQAAFQRKQEAMTRAELLRIGPSGYRSL
jgi:hypothetical protein